MSGNGPLLEARGLTIQFGGLRAVDSVSFAVRPGEVYTIVGPNGAGKTTVFNLISRIYNVTEGSIVFGGRDITAAPSHRIARMGIARTFQLVRVFAGLSVLDNVVAGMAFAGARRFGERAEQACEELLARVGLGRRGRELAGSLNYIDQKRLELARALASSPRVLLLDEWLAGLNPTELTEAIALAHDCGHGPAGHASEEAFSPYVPGGYDHAVYGADVTLAPLNLCRETLDGVRNHSWRRPAPATPEGEVVAWADRIAYVSHDFTDAVRAGILVPADLPDEITDVVGTSQSRQIGAFVLAVLDAIDHTSCVGMTEPARVVLL